MGKIATFGEKARPARPGLYVIFLRIEDWYERRTDDMKAILGSAK